jgi:hypothetical protein
VSFIPRTPAHAATYDVTAYGAIGNGVHDDTPNIQAAINAAQAAGGGTVYFPNTSANTYLLNSFTQSIDHPWCYYNLVVNSNVILQGDTTAQIKLLQGPNGRQLLSNLPGATWVRNSVVAVNPRYSAIAWQPPYVSLYPINNTTANSNTVTIKNTGDASHFAVGDYVCVYNDNTGDVILSQANKITAINGRTLTLADPLSRSFTAGTNIPSIACVTPYTTHDVQINNLILQGAEPLAVTETWNFSATSDEFYSDTSIGGGNLNPLQLNTLTHYNFSGNWFNVVNGPYSFAQELCQRNSQYGLWWSNEFWVKTVGVAEYTAHITFDTNTFNLYEDPSDTSGISLGGLDVDFENNTVNSNTNLNQNNPWDAIIIDDCSSGISYKVNGATRIVNNTINGAADGNAIVWCVLKDTVVAGNTFNMQNGTWAFAVHAAGLGYYNQTADIEGNNINWGATPGYGSGFEVETNTGVDGSYIINNTANAGTGSTGWTGAWIPDCSPNATGGHMMYNNSYTGFSNSVVWTPSQHPGTITTGHIFNPGFEYESLNPGWTSAGTVTIGDYTVAHQNSLCAKVSGLNSQVTQHVTGLTPGHTYHVQAWVKTNSTSTTAKFGASGYGSSTSVTSTATGWTKKTFTFTPTAGNTSADIYAQVSAGSGNFYFDDCFIYD